MSLERVFEHTDGALTARFSTNNRPNLDQLAELPCLLVTEGVKDEEAFVANIIRPRIAGNEVVFDYAVDQGMTSLQNKTIFAHRMDFDITNEFEFSRTHWAVKDVDLYRSLLRLVQPRRQRPTVFSIEEHERIEGQLVSVMMPFDRAFTPVYESIQQAADSAGLRCRRADDFWEAPAIIQDIVSLIDRAQVVICDCTNRNPNVFYETGIAHTLGREVILITQNAADIPFDLRHLRYISYLNNGEGRVALSTALADRLRTIVDR